MTVSRCPSLPRIDAERQQSEREQQRRGEEDEDVGPMALWVKDAPN